MLKLKSGENRIYYSAGDICVYIHDDVIESIGIVKNSDDNGKSIPNIVRILWLDDNKVTRSFANTADYSRSWNNLGKISEKELLVLQLKVSGKCVHYEFE